MGTQRPALTPRIVLDTNVALSALLFSRGSVGWLRSVWQQRQVRPLISQATARELIRVLAYPKFRLDADERESLLADYLPYCETVAIPKPPPEVPTCRDPHDLPFLHLAYAGRADWLVTGDSDLLALANAFTVPVVTPAALRELDGYPS